MFLQKETKLNIVDYLHGKTGWFKVWLNGEQKSQIEVPDGIY